MPNERFFRSLEYRKFKTFDVDFDEIDRQMPTPQEVVYPLLFYIDARSIYGNVRSVGHIFIGSELDWARRVTKSKRLRRYLVPSPISVDIVFEMSKCFRLRFEAENSSRRDKLGHYQAR